MFDVHLFPPLAFREGFPSQQDLRQGFPLKAGFRVKDQDKIERP
jgi:hypothetical protein